MNPHAMNKENNLSKDLFHWIITVLYLMTIIFKKKELAFAKLLISGWGK